MTHLLHAKKHTTNFFPIFLSTGVSKKSLYKNYYAPQYACVFLFNIFLMFIPNDRFWSKNHVLACFILHKNKLYCGQPCRPVVALSYADMPTYTSFRDLFSTKQPNSQLSVDDCTTGRVRKVHRLLKKPSGFHTLSQDRGTPSRICLSQSQDCGMMLENVDEPSISKGTFLEHTVPRRGHAVEYFFNTCNLCLHQCIRNT